MRQIISMALILAICGVSEGAAESGVANKFARDLNRNLPANGNLICSPLSVYDAMGMVMAGARGKTAEEMSAAGVRDSGAGPLVAGLKSDPNFQLHIANAIWAQTGFNILPQFQDLLSKQFDSTCFNLDFSDSAAASGRINGWVAEQTNGKIPQLFSPGALPRSTLMVLTNAIYFRADWESPFSPELSVLGDFHVPDQADPARRMMMHQHGSFPIMRSDEFDALELPYKGGEMAMLIVLPKSNDGLKALESKVNVDQVVAGLGRQFVEVSIPKFSFAWQASLVSALKSMGIRRAFSAGEADFSGIDGSGRLFLSEVMHKAYISVDEKGTEAAAATGAVMMPTAIPLPRAFFVADHPFLFFIRARSSGAVLFAGRVYDPGVK